MNTLLRWLDRAPMGWLVVLSVWMLVAPVTPEPHLLEKTRLLMAGTLSRPVDIFDLFFHLMPVTLLVLKWGRRGRAQSGQ